MKIRSISFKLIIILVLVITIVFFVLGFFLYVYENNKDKISFEKSSNETITRLKYNLVNPLWNFDVISIKSVLESEILINKSIVSISIFDEKYNLIISVNKNNNILEYRFNEENNILYDKAIEERLLFENIQFSIFRVYFTNKFYQELVINKIKEIILFCLSFSIIFLIVIFFSVKHFVLSKVIFLSKFFDRYDYDNMFFTKLYNDSNDEISNLTNSFNELLQNLRTIISQKDDLLKQLENNNHLLKKEIFERGKTEIKLKNTSNYLQKLLDIIPSYILVIDNNFNLVSSNISFNDSFIKENNDKHNILESLFFINDYKDIILNSIINLEQVSIENIKFYNNENYYYYNMVIKGFVNDNYNYAIINIIDVTEIVKKDEQIKYASKIETAGTLLSGITHDFNNFLSGIISTIYFMKKNNNIDKESYDNLLTIEKSIQNISNLVNQLSSLTKKTDSKKELFNLIEAINNSYKMVKSTFDDSVKVEIDFNTYDSAYIIGDQSQIEQILINLYINSYHSMTLMRKDNSKYGGLLKINLDKFFDNNKNVFWKIRISDNGVGIPENIKDRIFDPYFTTKNDKGSGLGLSIVYNLIKNHNGKINLFSIVDEGTIFEILFPFADSK